VAEVIRPSDAGLYLCWATSGMERDTETREVLRRRVLELEAKLRDQEQRYRLVLAGADAAIWDWNVPAKTVFFSPRWKELRGLSPEEVSNREEEWRRGIHPDDFDRVMAAVQEHFEGRTPSFAVEYRVRRKDGHWIWILDRGLAEWDAEGNVVRMAGSETDISERKRTETQLMARLHQQAVLAELGQHALGTADLQTLMDEAVENVAHALEAEYCKILEIVRDGTALVLRAGVGWREGQVGRAIVDAGPDSQAGYTLARDRPVVVEDLRSETRFRGAPLLLDHDVVSGMSLVIQRQGRAYGVLGVHTKRRRLFTEHDVNFLQAVANILGAAIDQRESEQVIRELSTPVLPLMEAVRLVPVVGKLDEQRARQLENRLLQSVRAYRARAVVLDMTGAEYSGDWTTSLLAGTVEATGLLGAQVVVTGIAAEFAAVLVRDWEGRAWFRTAGDLMGVVQEAERLVRAGS
jgi:PAS domain S-box-containing protein